jgi:Transcription elongation factor, GreA/GreB, C-term
MMSLRRAWRRSNMPSQRPAKLSPPRKHQPIGQRLPLRAETFATGLPGARRRASYRPPTDHSEVRFGTSVTIVRDDGREQTFRIVGEDEADPAQGSISQVSPLARAMFGKRVGDVVQAGAGGAEIIRIQ